MNNLYDELAEQTVIGGLMFNDKTDVAVDVLSILKPSDFANPSHKLIWEVILNLSGNGHDINAVTVPSTLQDLGTDLSSYVMRLGIDAVSQASLVNTAYRLRKVSKLRKAMEAINEAAAEINKNGDPEERLRNAMSKVADIGDDDGDQEIKDPVTVMTDVFYMMESALSSKTGLVGISSGFENIDRMTNGFQKQDLIVVAAPPSCGKTTLTLNFAENAVFLSKDPKKVLFFSLEMSELQLIQRLVVMESEVDSHRYKTATLGNGEIDELEIHRKSMQSLPIYIDDTPALSVIDLRAKARRLKQQYGIELLIIDYLQLMTTGRKERGNREQEISYISRMLKVIAKELNIPVIALSQLSRASEARPDKKPLLSDLRESGAIEQDADMVIFVHRPEYYGMENEGDTNAQLIVAKHRNGDTGIINLNWIGELTKFTDPKKTYKPSSGISPNTDFYKENNNDPF